MKKIALPLFLSLAGTLVCFNVDGTEISPVPLTTLGISGAVKPNIMVLLDNSGSMDWDYVGDWANDTYCKKPDGTFTGYCCISSSSASSGSGSNSCLVGSAPFGSWRGQPPFLTNDFNGVAYNPQVVYLPPKNSDGTSKNSMNAANTSSWTSVPNDAYGKSSATGSINLTTQYPDTAWCSDTGLTTCVRNDNYLLPGTISGTNYQYFKYTVASGTGNKATGSVASPSIVAGTFGPHYYAIIPGEYCTTDRQDVCHTQAAPDATYRVPATVRWCSDSLLQTCQKTKTDTFQYPRYPGRTVTSTATIVVGGSGSRSINGITVNGQQIMKTGSGSSTSSNTIASNTVTNINACTSALSGSCTVTGYSATASGSTITINAPIGAVGVTYTPVVSKTGSLTTTITAFNGVGGSVPGSFKRVDIISTVNSYPDPANLSGQKHPNRIDCAGSTCTYAEEMTNFANWWAYYRTRMQMMKTSLSLAFNNINSNYNVGYALLSDVGYGGTVTTSSHGMYPAVFDSTNRSSWYSKLFATDTSSSTALRVALDQIGRMYANLAPYNLSGTSRVVQYACQQNFALVTTDGYWNETWPPSGVSYSSISNNDKTENSSYFCTRAAGCVDPSNASNGVSLSDVALYWYNGGSNTAPATLRTDLESNLSAPGKVPFTASDPNTHLHMTTYTLGLGMSGNVTYEKNYDTSPDASGDFIKIVNNSANWPQAVGDTASALDDLWHAAINGHGKYFSARTPTDVVNGLTEALSNMQIRVAAASAAATSTPNITQLDNYIFSSTFTTGKWFGEVIEQQIDTSTGSIIAAVNWSTSNTLGTRVSSNSDTRQIYMSDGSTTRRNFQYSVMTATEKTWFNNKGSTMAQYASLNTTDQATADSGTNLVNYLRGQFQYADDRIYRSFTLYGFTTDPQNLTFDAATNPYIILGDVANAKPAYVRTPFRSYNQTGYADYVAAQANRPGTVYIASNDGMLHAFDASNGNERWAYVPRITMSKLYKLASTTYATNHIYTVDGSPETADVLVNGAWKTILVAGLNDGGRGYYALDITNPNDPQPLWEFCADSSICSKNDPDLGLTYGNPQIGMWNGQWVVLVTSGYNNIPGSDFAGSGGNGQGYLYILSAADGSVLKKIGTGVGTATDTGSAGLARIAAITSNPQVDPVFTYVYGGDVQGNMWRFDLTHPPSVIVTNMAALGPNQPITAKPDVTLCSAGNSTQRVVAFGTGRFLGSSDTIYSTSNPASTATQAFYVLKDLADGAVSGYGSLIGNSSLIQQTMSSSGTIVNMTNHALDWTGKIGWYTNFDTHTTGTSTPTERVNLDPKIVLGSANVVTNLPTSPDACSIGGSSYQYAFNVCGTTTDQPDAAVGNLLSNTSPAVGFIVIRLPNGKLVEEVTLASGEKKKQDLTGNTSAKVRKSAWRSTTND